MNRPQSPLLDLSTVVEREASVLAERRQAHNANDPEFFEAATSDALQQDVRGLAISGGGIRSASFALGFVQALESRAVTRLFDYLSTVSGGGYLGAHLSSTTARTQQAPANGELYSHLAVDRAGALKQPRGVLRFIYGGKYLFRPWQFIQSYLFGLMINTVATVAILLLCSFSLAWLYRTLDSAGLNDRLWLVGLNHDVDLAMLPSVILLLLWLPLYAWITLRQKQGLISRISQILFYGFAGTALLGLTIVLVNGTSSLGDILQSLTDSKRVTAPSNLRWLLTAVVGCGLLPLLRPQALLQRGLHPKNKFDSILFCAVCSCAMIGVPLIVFGLAARENISQTWDAPHNNIRPGDIYDWPAFCGLIVNPKESIEAAADPDADDLLSQVQTTLAARKDMKSATAALTAEPGLWNYGALLTTRKGWDTARSFLASSSEFRERANRLCKLVDSDVLTKRLIPVALVKKEPFVDYLRREQTSDEVEDDPLSTAAVHNALLDLHKQLDDAHGPADVIEMVRQAGHDVDAQTDDDWKELNRGLLFAMHPECFHDPNTVRTDVVHESDQKVRLYWIAGTALVCLFCLFINFNLTSVHAFYRERLTSAYLPGAADLRLSQLGSGKSGAPYHLINASLHRFDSRFGKLVEDASDDLPTSQSDPDRRSVRNFLFSEQHCGSEVTGFTTTSRYEQSCSFGNDVAKTELTLANAMAISGAAVTPVQFDFAPLAWLMSALNFRLGQWLPHPREADPGRPRLYKFALDSLAAVFTKRKVEDRRFCYVSDGGLSDNLGVIPLIKRRCRLIVSVDAACDDKHTCNELAKVLRYARVKDGVEFTNLTGDGPISPRPLTLNDKRLVEEHFVVGLIKYPATDLLGPETGLFVYLKPSLTGDEGHELTEQRNRDAEFPHDNTADQFFDDNRVESYRQLGFHIGAKMLDKVFTGAIHKGQFDYARIQANAAALTLGGERVEDLFETLEVGFSALATGERPNVAPAVPAGGARPDEEVDGAHPSDWRPRKGR